MVKKKLNYIFIWCWYSDWFRMFIILIPTHFIFTIPIMYLLNVSIDTMETVCTIQYLTMLGLILYYNDYSNLRKIGLDEYRKPLKK